MCARADVMHARGAYVAQGSVGRHSRAGVCGACPCAQVVVCMFSYITDLHTVENLDTNTVEVWRAWPTPLVYVGWVCMRLAVFVRASSIRVFLMICELLS